MEIKISEVEKAARALGHAMQNDERYKAYYEAKKANDDDAVLQEKIGKFNLIRMNLDNALSAAERDEDAIKNFNEELRTVYGEIMNSDSMKNYNAAKQAMDTMMNEINSIITMCSDGADPDTCDVSSCTGNCSTCSGCH